MNVLDENLASQQSDKLKGWRIPFRQIGRDLAAHGTLDENLLPLLHRLPQPTFFTHDRDFFQASLCHSHYALIDLDVGDEAAAEFIRRFLKHPAFNTIAKRLGIVARIHTNGVQFWKKGTPSSRFVAWSE